MRSKNDYLDMMGIQRWRANAITDETLGVVGFSSWLLVNTQTNQLSAVLHLEANTSHFEQTEIDQLLDTMLAAVHLKRGTLLQNDEAMSANLLRIIMGEALARHLLNETSTSFESLQAKNAERLNSPEPALVVHHPNVLLTNPKLKRSAWENLKILRNQLLS
ncbi:MAG: hypothetical protein K0Q74_297 [Gammaproteobacteria bacterium]|jgi:hypothetical protein|nr:hypothetical protein [Gammaproteobacteria bacterium]